MTTRNDPSYKITSKFCPTEIEGKPDDHTRPLLYGVSSCLLSLVRLEGRAAHVSLKGGRRRKEEKKKKKKRKLFSMTVNKLDARV